MSEILDFGLKQNPKHYATSVVDKKKTKKTKQKKTKLNWFVCNSKSTSTITYGTPCTIVFIPQMLRGFYSLVVIKIYINVNVT